MSENIKKSELLEVLNENGVGSGMPKPRDEVHRNGLCIEQS